MGRRVLSESSLRARVWLVLAYSAVFEFPLSAEEVFRRLWRFAGESLPTLAQINTSLQELFSLGVIARKGDWWYLLGQPQASANRQQWTKNSQIKLQQATPIISFLTKLPWVVGVAITGSVAVNSAKPNDDIDFMVVTEPNRLWLTRLLTLIVAMKHGKRRSFAKEEPNSWCFNLWLSTNSLAVPPERRSLYTAYEVCQVRWVFNRDKVIEGFLTQNSWVREIIPNFYCWCEQRAREQKRSPFSFELGPNIIIVVFGSILTMVDWCLSVFQRFYMKHHQTNEVVDYHKAYFHPRDSRAMILDKLKSLTANIL
ncbi:MAG TPA: hypothetical protein PKJ26_00315 [Candidatus Woesebacteria bacterium]|nr:hypothetical protein [Candidatus Woesebacteria bacterium]HNS64920.1 hypothetical protein [Candidatus Woesebacteria bacterium]